MKRWKAILAATLIFAMGVATGALAFRAFNPTRGGGFPTMMWEARFDALRRMEKDLALTAEQSRRVSAILEEGRKCTHGLWESIAPQMRDESKRVRDRIRAELTPDQQATFEELVKRSREKHGARPPGDRRGSPSPADPGTNAPPPSPGVQQR